MHNIYKFFTGLLLVLGFTTTQANVIDTKCPQFTYKSAPVINASQYLCKTQYAIAFSYATKNAIYTTEFVTASHFGPIPRSNNFHTDTAVPTRYRVSSADYTGTMCNGDRCDRGHLTPNLDFTACDICGDESFLMTNIVPQNYKNNQGIWKALEDKVHDYVVKGNDVFVITGPIYIGIPSTISTKNIWVPSALFKIIVNARTGKSIAFVVENISIPVTKLSQKVVNIETIEVLTGIVFESTLDKKTVAKFLEW